MVHGDEILTTTVLAAPRQAKADHVFAVLKEEILAGVLGPNQRLVERELVERFGISKTPIREALSMLRTEGLVRGRYYGGLTVVKLSRDSLQQLYQVREALEGLAAGLSAVNASPELRERLEANIAAQEAGVYDDRFYGLNGAFHRLILEGAGNAVLMRTLGRLYDENPVLATSRINPVLNQPKARSLTVLAEHMQLATYVLERNAPAAENCAREHVRNAFKRLAGI